MAHRLRHLLRQFETPKKSTCDSISFILVPPSKCEYLLNSVKWNGSVALKCKGKKKKEIFDGVKNTNITWAQQNVHRYNKHSLYSTMISRITIKHSFDWVWKILLSPLTTMNLIRLTRLKFAPSRLSNLMRGND